MRRVNARVKEALPLVDWDRLPLMLNETEAAAVLGVSISFLRKGRCDGLLKHRTPAPPFVAIGGRRYYRTADLKLWVENLVPQQAMRERFLFNCKLLREKIRVEFVYLGGVGG
jgi:hypothetical protein